MSPLQSHPHCKVARPAPTLWKANALTNTWRQRVPAPPNNRFKISQPMTKETAIKLFEEKQVHTVWDADQEKWYISIVDVIDILTESPNPRKYWSVLKTRLKAEGSQLATNCSQLKMEASDGKLYQTAVADTEQLFRLIQSIK